MKTIYFPTIAEAKNSAQFKNKDYVRVLRNMNKTEGDFDYIEMEMIDFGTHLCHHDIVSINFDRTN